MNEIVKPRVGRFAQQQLVALWVRGAFGEETMRRYPERGARLVEEAVEFGQAVDVPREIAHKIVDYVYDKPKGDPFQEAGGVGVTLLALCECLGISAEDAENTEIARVLMKDLDYFRARHAAKHAKGITPGISGAAA